MNPVSVLVVDDCPPFLDAAVYFLEVCGRGEVVIAGTACRGKEAIEKAKSLQPQVVLIDWHMPGMSGLEAIPLLRKVLPEGGIIVLTLLDLDAYRQAALAAGADDFVSKVTMNTDLLPAIRRVLQSSQTPGKQYPAEQISLLKAGETR